MRLAHISKNSIVWHPWLNCGWVGDNGVEGVEGDRGDTHSSVSILSSMTIEKAMTFGLFLSSFRNVGSAYSISDQNHTEMLMKSILKILYRITLRRIFFLLLFCHSSRKKMNKNWGAGNTSIAIPVFEILSFKMCSNPCLEGSFKAILLMTNIDNLLWCLFLLSINELTNKLRFNIY